MGGGEEKTRKKGGGGGEGDGKMKEKGWKCTCFHRAHVIYKMRKENQNTSFRRSKDEEKGRRKFKRL